MNEEWRDIEGFEGLYQVSNNGMVRSLDRDVLYKSGARRKYKGRVLKPTPTKSGHLTVDLRNSHARRVLLVHRLVLSAFEGPCPEGMECCHNDGNPSNNELINLRWDTHESNVKDMVTHQSQARGERHGNARLTASDVGRIRRIHAATGLGYSRLAEMFDVSRTNIRKIVRNQRWTHI